MAAYKWLREYVFLGKERNVRESYREEFFWVICKKGGIKGKNILSWRNSISKESMKEMLEMFPGQGVVQRNKYRG